MNKVVSIVNAYKAFEDGKKIDVWRYHSGQLKKGDDLLFIKSSKGITMQKVLAPSVLHNPGSVTRNVGGHSYGTRQKTVYDRPSSGPHSVAAKAVVILTNYEATQFAEAIDSMYIGSAHTDVKNNLIWKAIYQVKARHMPFKGATPGTSRTELISTIPCHSCGIILPDDAIQVDHYMPQASFQSLYVTKMLRVLGLTEGKATGLKGSSFDPSTLDGLDDDKIYPKGRVRGNLDYLSKNTVHTKWTTTPKGSAFLSLIQSVSHFNDFSRMCMNSLINLTPLCGLCNQRKSDREKPIV